MKNHLFCVGAEVGPAPAGTPSGESFLSAYVNVYVGANDLREALARVESALQQDGYRVVFIRGCWVVDADCNDGFCPADELSSELSGGLLFSDAVHYGTFRDRIGQHDYAY
ncbi:hypothetical protein D3C78_1186150 [compost metagenome]